MYQPTSQARSQASPRQNFGNPLAPDLTDRDFSRFMPVSATGGLIVEFYYARIRFGGNTGPYAGKFETRLFVALQPRGDRLSVAHVQLTEEDAMREYPAEWHAFKTYQDTPTSGTPLHELPGTSNSMIGVLVLHGIRSIEDLVNLPADVANQIGLDAVTARNIALSWVSKKSEAGNSLDLAEELARTSTALEDAMMQLRVLRENAVVQERTLAALTQMGGAPAQAAAQYGTGEAVAVDTEGYDRTEAAPDVLSQPAVVRGMDDLGLGNPLED